MVRRRYATAADQREAFVPACPRAAMLSHRTVSAEGDLDGLEEF